MAVALLRFSIKMLLLHSSNSQEVKSYVVLDFETIKFTFFDIATLSSPFLELLRCVSFFQSSFISVKSSVNTL